MITHCSKCDTNWACLWTCDGEDDEQVDVCPVCLTDSFLGDATDIEAYIKCQITGKIINPVTGNEKGEVKKKPVIRVKVGMPDPVEKVDRDELQMMAINKYHKALDDGHGRDAAEQAYFDTFQIKSKA